jgi:hypothetical protein
LELEVGTVEFQRSRDHQINPPRARTILRGMPPQAAPARPTAHRTKLMGQLPAHRALRSPAGGITIDTAKLELEDHLLSVPVTSAPRRYQGRYTPVCQPESNLRIEQPKQHATSLAGSRFAPLSVIEICRRQVCWARRMGRLLSKRSAHSMLHIGISLIAPIKPIPLEERNRHNVPAHRR